MGLVVLYNCSKGNGSEYPTEGNVRSEGAKWNLTGKCGTKFFHPLDRKQILCYNKDVPRTETNLWRW
jgi:hypothetical protein